MGSVIRAVAVYLIMVLLLRIAGRRTLAQITTFDLVLMLIISESIQQGLIDDDNSMTNAILVVTTLVGIDILMSVLKNRFPRLGRIIDGLPVVIMSQGKPQREHMRAERVDEADILAAARENHGLAHLGQVEYAVVEQSGRITIVPKEEA